MTMIRFLRTLEARINKTNEIFDKKSKNFIDNRYSSPISNPFMINKTKTIVWIEKE